MKSAPGQTTQLITIPLAGNNPLNQATETAKQGARQLLANSGPDIADITSVTKAQVRDHVKFIRGSTGTQMEEIYEQREAGETFEQQQRLDLLEALNPQSPSETLLAQNMVLSQQWGASCLSQANALLFSNSDSHQELGLKLTAMGAKFMALFNQQLVILEQLRHKTTSGE